MSRTCPAPTCEVRLAPDLFACRDHWYALPAAARSRINRAWRARVASPHDKRLITRHELAKAAAVEYLERLDHLQRRA